LIISYPTQASATTWLSTCQQATSKLTTFMRTLRMDTARCQACVAKRSMFHSHDCCRRRIASATSRHLGPSFKHYPWS
jgi:hypothetical protein